MRGQKYCGKCLASGSSSEVRRGTNAVVPNDLVATTDLTWLMMEAVDQPVDETEAREPEHGATQEARTAGSQPGGS